MSEFASYVASQLVPVAKQYGVKRVLSVVSSVSFFLFAFVFWAEILVLIWPTCLVSLSFWSYIAFAIGGFALISLVISVCTSLPLIIGFQRRFMKKIENVSTDEEKCKSIAKTYSIIPELCIIGGSSLTRTRLVLESITIVFDISATYSLLVLLVTYGNELIQFLISTWEMIAQTLRLPAQSIIGLTFLLFVLLSLSLYFFVRLYSDLTRLLKANKVNRGARFYLPLSLFSSLVFRLGLLFTYLGTSVDSLSADRLHLAFYQPFPISSNIEPMVQKSFNSIQGKECTVTEYECSIENEKELCTLVANAKEFFGQTVGGTIATRGIDRVKPFEALDIINKQETRVYTGFVEKQCVFSGTVYFSTIEKARTAYFYFENEHVMKEFQAIVQKQIEEARRLQPTPPNATSLSF